MTITQTVRRVLLGSPTPDVEAALRDTLGQLGQITPQLASPFASTAEQLQTVVWTDVFGGDYRPTTRAAAMAVPAIARARHILCGTLARLPLVVMTRDQVDPNQPSWCQRTDGDLPPYHRMLWTADDLLFYGWSLWAASRGAVSDGSPVLGMARVPFERWTVDTGTRTLLVDNQPVMAGQAVLIPGPHGGILNDQGQAIRMAADNLAAAANAAANPVPNIDLHYIGDDPIPDEERDAIIELWSAKRRSKTGGVAWTNRFIEAKPLGAHDAHLLTEGRQADAIDAARMASVPASLLDAPSGDSLTYTTDASRNQQMLDYGVQLYMDPIAARLSQDDVVARGKRTGFDTTQLTSLTPNPTGVPTDD